MFFKTLNMFLMEQYFFNSHIGKGDIRDHNSKKVLTLCIDR